MTDPNDTLTKQLYVYCGVCLTPEAPFYLTSCAHILCQAHSTHLIDKTTQNNSTHSHNHNHNHSNSHNHIHAHTSGNTQSKDKTPLTCPVCNTPNISLIALTKSTLPKQLTSYFEPFLPNLEAIYAIAKFQYEGLQELAKYQAKQVVNLQAKIGQHRNTIRTARSEIAKAGEYKS